MSGVNAKRFSGVLIVLLIVLSFIFAVVSYANKPTEPVSTNVPMGTPDVFFGVDAAFGNVAELKTIINEVKSYTNLFVVGSTAITQDQGNINDVCQYLNDSGLHFLTYAHLAGDYNFSQQKWADEARQKWGTNFMGFYAYDEAGGHQIDRDNPYMVIQEASNYTDAATLYARNLTYFLSGVDVPLFTSDYALYEFDYRGGYGTVFAEFAWNNDKQLNIALDRGAATVHNKDWGVMITGSYNDSRYIFTAPEMYNDLILAYQNGAKYLLVFDYPTLANGILKKDYFDALQLFWQYLKNHPRTNTVIGSRVAYVLPAGYGYGFRGPADKIWGLWEADNQSAKIWNEASSLTKQYSPKLDIIYEDDLQLNISAYNKFIFWNGTVTVPK